MLHNKTYIAKRKWLTLLVAIVAYMCSILGMSITSSAAATMTLDSVLAAVGVLDPSDANRYILPEYGTPSDDYVAGSKVSIRKAGTSLYTIQSAGSKAGSADTATRAASNCATALLRLSNQEYSDLKLLVNTNVYYSTSGEFRAIYPDDEQAVKDFNDTVKKFNSTLASYQVESSMSEIFDTQEWAPSAGIAQDVLSVFYSVCNQLFYIFATTSVWWFMVQTGADIVYYLFEPLRPWIGRPKTVKGTAGYGGTQTSAANPPQFCIPIASQTMIKICEGESTAPQQPSYGHQPATQNALSAHPIVSYSLGRIPILLFVGVYLVLLSLGYWSKFIGLIAGCITQVFDWVI